MSDTSMPMQPVKRGRGRPKGSKTKNRNAQGAKSFDVATLSPPTFNANDVAQSAAAASLPTAASSRRGRPTGSRTTTNWNEGARDAHPSMTPSATATGSRTRRRAARGKLRRNATVDSVMVEEPFTFSLAPEHANLMEQLHLSEDALSGENGQVGDGCFVSCTVHRRRYYGVLVDQNVLKAANGLHFKDEAESLNLNRRMMFLAEQEKQRSRNDNESNKAVTDNHNSCGNEKKRSRDAGDNEDDEAGKRCKVISEEEGEAMQDGPNVEETMSAPLSVTSPDTPSTRLNPPTRNVSAFILYQNSVRDKVKAQHPDIDVGQMTKHTSAMYAALSEDEKQVWIERAADDKARYDNELANYDPPARATREHDGFPVAPQPSEAIGEEDNRQVQKFAYVPQSSGPGYRRLLATYANVHAAAEDKPSKIKEIIAACQSGGNFVGGYYYQFQVSESSLNSQPAFETGHVSDYTRRDIRTSVSLNSFLQHTTLPPWYPLSNLEGFSQSKVLSMLQLKKNKKGGIDWTNNTDLKQRGAMSTGLGQVALPMAPRKSFRIGVLGGGIAGLACSAELLRLAGGFDERLDIEVVLLEARSRVGGRLHTDCETFKTVDGHGFPVDLGASWIHGIDGNPLTNLADEAGVDLVRASEEVKMLSSNMKEVQKDVDKKMGTFFDELLDQAANDCWSKYETARVDETKRQQKAVRWYAPVLKDDAVPNKDSVLTAADIPIHRHSTDISIDHAIGIALGKRQNVSLSTEQQNLLYWHTKNTEYALGANISDLSMKYWDSDEGHAFEGDHVLLKQGYSKLADHLLTRCKRHKQFDIILDFPIGKIEYARASTSHPAPEKQGRMHKLIDLSDSCRVTSRDGKRIQNFDFLVCALPLGVLKESTDAVPFSGGSDSIQSQRKLLFEPPLPQLKRDAIDAVGFGLLNKVYVQFPHAFWRKAGANDDDCGSPFLYDGQNIFGNASGVNPHHYMFHDVGRSLCGANADEPPAILLSLVSGREAVNLEKMPTDESVQEVMATLRTIFSGVDVPNPVAIKVTRWGSDEFSRGCYSFLPPGATDQDYSTLQSPVNGNGDSLVLSDLETMRLFWAGEHTTSLHPSMAHGALLSGIRAAKEVVAATHVKSRSDISDVDRPIPVTVFRSKHPTLPVQCQFCHLLGSREKEGSLFAVQQGSRRALVHINCASYSSEVDNTDGAWKNVLKAVSRGKHIKCALCGKSGATIGCTNEYCSRSYHFGCAEKTDWSFEQHGKALLCKLHRRKGVQNNAHNDLVRNAADSETSRHPNSDCAIDLALFSRMAPMVPIVCQLCGSGVDKHRGELMAFYRREVNKHALVHKNCARFSNNVDVIDGSWDSGKGMFENVIDTVLSAKDRHCSTCKKSGASVECSDSSCTLAFHFPCAEDTGWSFNKKGQSFLCDNHRAGSVPTKGLIPPLNPPKPQVQHDLFVARPENIEVIDGVDESEHLPDAIVAHEGVSSEVRNDDEIQYQAGERSSVESAKDKGEDEPTAFLSSESNEESGPEDGSGDSEYTQDSNQSDGDDDENDSDDDGRGEYNAMDEPFTVDPHLEDQSIGGLYTVRKEINARRSSTSDPWHMQVILDNEISSSTTLRVHARVGEDFTVYGLRKGDIILSINGTKVGSPSLLNMDRFLGLIATLVEMKIEVIRVPELI